MRKSRWTESYARFEPWVFGEQKDAAAFAAAMKLMDLEDRWIRIRAEDQRQLFGFVPFGKRLVNVASQAKDPDGFILRVSRKVCFGTDHDTAYFTWPLFQELLNQRRKVM